MAITAIRKMMNLDEPAPAAPNLPTQWPPSKEDGDRFRAYEHYRAIWHGKHALALDEQDIAGRYGQYIAVNLPRIIVTIPSDFLFGEEFELSYDEGTPKAAQDVVAEIVKRSKLHTLLYESSLDCGIYGDSVLAVERNDAGEALIKTQPVSTWVPELNGDDIREAMAHWFGWKRILTLAGKERDFLRLIKHEPGKMFNFLLEIQKDGTLTAAPEEAWTALYPDGKPEAQIDTSITPDGVDGFAVEIVPSWRTSEDYHGVPEYRDLDGMVASLNARVTQNDQVLHRHSDPMLSLPNETYKALKSSGSATDPRTRNTVPGRIDKSRLDVVSQGPNGEKPEYTVWDGKLTDNGDFIDRLINLIALVSETAPQLLNQGEWGGDLSGRALKIMLVRTLAKVNRRRKYYSDAIPNILVKAQMVEGIKNPVRPEVRWPDGLPQDIQEAIDVAEKKLAAGIETKVGAIMSVDDLSEEAAKKKAAEVQAEEDANRNSEGLNNAVSGQRQPALTQRANPIEVRLGN